MTQILLYISDALPLTTLLIDIKLYERERLRLLLKI